METTTMKGKEGISEDLKNIMNEVYKVTSIVRAAGFIAHEHGAGEEHTEDIGNLTETATDILDLIHKLLFERWEENEKNKITADVPKMERELEYRRESSDVKDKILEDLLKGHKVRISSDSLLLTGVVEQITNSDIHLSDVSLDNQPQTRGMIIGFGSIGSLLKES